MHLQKELLLEKSLIKQTVLVNANILSYEEQLRKTEWLNLRKKLIELNKFQCSCCI